MPSKKGSKKKKARKPNAYAKFVKKEYHATAKKIHRQTNKEGKALFKATGKELGKMWSGQSHLKSKKAGSKKKGSKKR